MLAVSWCAAFGQDVSANASLRLLLFGDVNLGRAVGQQLVKGNIGYPFSFVRERLGQADVVFVNLESQLSDQKGETQHPQFNLIFTGPPQGARALKEAHVSVVSTANNHAFDYGKRGLVETIENLKQAGVHFVGTSHESTERMTPAIVERNGFRLGFLAYTQFVNLKGTWRGNIAVYEKTRARTDIEAVRDSVDYLIVSYHAGSEYVDRPSERLRDEFHDIIDSGADMVIGHHPHYVQGIELYHGKPIFFSLGNFVFYQPQREWTRYGLGLSVELVRSASGVEPLKVGLEAVHAGLQPTFDLAEGDRNAFFQRLISLSSASIVYTDGLFYLDSKGINEN